MAVINHTWKFIFVHIPKCGGTTVSHVLDQLCSYKDLVLGGSPEAELIHKAYQMKYGISKHSLGVELRRFFGHEAWTTYTTFATVRNPLERTISTFRYLKTHQDHYAFMQGIDTMSEFLDHDRWQERGPDRMFLPQQKWLFEEQRQRRRIVDHLVPLEKLDSELPRLLSDIGVPKSVLSTLDFTAKNQSVEVDKPALSDRDIERINLRYSCDSLDKLSVRKLGNAEA